ncbi:hypothetical protein CALVIDRAFT_113191 [Calocera viscosa TUFC12733]|uniref:BZIP domain-containing protein n=1 Tax=Calocera viscosa (strain TUFC12733) TaxID=1330018 RepID=A0A167M4G7_CALVF|nr:hypothetical protein CALVIDRAFT_113191 [Calocera viscosa TUFC12733]
MTHMISSSGPPDHSARASLFTTITLPTIDRHMWLPTMPIPSIDRTQQQPSLAPAPASTNGSPAPALNRNGAPSLSSATIASAAYGGAARGQYEEKPHGYSGFRKGLEPDMLRPVDAPPEPRTTSISPSADGTERIDSSSVSDVIMNNDDSRAQYRGDSMSTSPPDADSVVARMQADRARRRSQNTLAARRSRARKLDTMLKLETERDSALARVADLEERLTNALAENAALRGRLNMVETRGGS